MENESKFYLIVQGEKVEVGEEVYREYVRPVRKDQRRKRRDRKCLVIGKKWQNGKMQIVRCQIDCNACPYAVNGKPNGSTLSLDEMQEKGFEIEDADLDLEADCVEAETKEEMKEQLHKAIMLLTPRQQEMVRLIYFEGKTQKEVAEHFGIKQPTVQQAVKRLIATLKKFF